jgi:hypothetical protein
LSQQKKVTKVKCLAGLTRSGSFVTFTQTEPSRNGILFLMATPEEPHPSATPSGREIASFSSPIGEGVKGVLHNFYC